MATIPIGTVVTKFSNTFIRTDPDYVKGLGLWRQVLTPPVPDDIYGIAAILPIVATNTVTTQSVNVSFDIDGLDAIGTAVGTYSDKNKAIALSSAGPSALPGAPQIKQVNTILPVESIKINGADVLYFDIGALEAHTLSRKADEALRKSRVAIKPYNVNSSVQITSDPPMVDEVNNDVATFSFDISDLNYV